MSNFFSLPRELRDQIYELCLLHPEPVHPRTFYWERRDFTPGLFLASKAVYLEASSFFYSRNSFSLTTSGPEDVASFLRRTGGNANYIRHVIVFFPLIQLELDRGNIVFEDACVSILKNLQSHCPNLSKLTTSRDDTYGFELCLVYRNQPKLVTEALKAVDTRFRAIPSLQEIVAETYDSYPNDHIRSTMESQGWKIMTAAYLEEDEFDSGWCGFEDGHYDDDKS
ncbi:hypothetical protein MGN70_013822 [Eutypa lata]|nr:hypothetical protein MGN70_013822 [Eutypa lata]